MDGLLPFIAMGIFLGVWEEDIRPWIDGTAEPTEIPYTLKVKEHFRWTSITQAANQNIVETYDNPHQPKRSAIPKPQAYKSLSTSALSSQFHKIAVLLGWKSELDIVRHRTPTNNQQDFVSKTFRYTWVAKMTGKISDVRSLHPLGSRLTSHTASPQIYARSSQRICDGRNSLSSSGPRRRLGKRETRKPSYRPSDNRLSVIRGIQCRHFICNTRRHLSCQSPG